ncbi:methyltransferase domain-containing protein [Salinactinospora qingdaonensis]|uniref:Protein-L-isoaspartate O-methyltransferase n=1 Tax=Salinactinospora qingdaonensis TaxID=702744 RepID=A0ABP7GK34_9ACTN
MTRQRRYVLADILAGGGHLTDPAWRGAVERVPRHRFIPETVWVDDSDGWLSPVSRDDPRWWDGIYADRVVVTQVDDGHAEGVDGRGRYPTSSASQPRMVSQMLHALAAEDGMSVLEIGTATGYNCALLCERFGSANVTSIEIDPDLARQGAANLHALGYTPTLAVGDGTSGVPDHAPFDRVLATVAAKHVPGAWIAQTRPGGVIVTPWGSDFGGHWLLRLTATGDGLAHGRIIGSAAFIWLRGQRSYRGTWSDHIDFSADLDPGTTSLDPRALLAEPGSGQALVLGTLVPKLYRVVAVPKGDTEEFTVWVYDAEGSWAAVDYVPGAGKYAVGRYGPRDLWSEVERAYQAWWRAGGPPRNRLGLTVTVDGQQRLWCDDPGNVLAPLGEAYDL